MQIEVGVAFSVFCALVGVFATYSKLRRDFKQDEEKRANELAQQKEKQTERHIEITKGLEYISKDVGKLDEKMCAMSSKVDELSSRLIKVEESTKSAHKRIDDFER
ncbi:MAG: hypothetical protein KH972_02520 [Peptostreptococcaceae bacterium]|nr:hypothetical protein [Peptostreptococcaceae bacterium]